MNFHEANKWIASWCENLENWTGETESTGMDKSLLSPFCNVSWSYPPTQILRISKVPWERDEKRKLSRNSVLVCSEVVRSCLRSSQLQLWPSEENCHSARLHPKLHFVPHNFIRLLFQESFELPVYANTNSLVLGQTGAKERMIGNESACGFVVIAWIRTSRHQGTREE